MSPEILKGLPYSYEVDIFPLAIITFILLTGEHPFLVPSHKQAVQDKNVVSLERIRYADWQWEGFTMSPTARDFIESIGSEFPERRKQIEELASHPFITRQVKIVKAPSLNLVKGAFSQSTSDGTTMGEMKAIHDIGSLNEVESKSDFFKDLKQENRLLKFELKLRLNPSSIDPEDEELFPMDPRESYTAKLALNHMFGVLT